MNCELLKNSKTIIYFEKQNKDLIEKAKYFLDRENIDKTNLVKSQHGSTRDRIVYKAEVNNEVFYFKRFVNHSMWKVIQDLFRSQRATRAMFLRKKMYNHQIACYDIRFAMIDTHRIFNRPSMIVTKEYRGKSISDKLAEGLSKEEKRQVLDKLVNFYVKMLKNGFYHGDPNFTNFIIEDNEIKLIDIDDITHHSKINTFMLKRNLMKFNRILLFLSIRPKNQKLDFSNKDREYIIKEIIKRFNKELNHDKLWNWLERKSNVKIHEVTKFVESYENLRTKQHTQDSEKKGQRIQELQPINIQ